MTIFVVTAGECIGSGEVVGARKTRELAIGVASVYRETLGRTFACAGQNLWVTAGPNPLFIQITETQLT